MDKRPSGFFNVAIASMLFVAVAACTPSYVNQEDLGAASTAEQVVAHYSGKSVKYANQRGAKPNIEAYFATDGTYKLVSLTDPIFAVGTWEATSGISRVNMVIQAKTYVLSKGKTFTESNSLPFVVYIQPDGTANADQMGGGNFGQPKPTPGIQAEKRWNSLRRQAGI